MPNSTYSNPLVRYEHMKKLGMNPDKDDILANGLSKAEQDTLDEEWVQQTRLEVAKQNLTDATPREMGRGEAAIATAKETLLPAIVGTGAMLGTTAALSNPLTGILAGLGISYLAGRGTKAVQDQAVDLIGGKGTSEKWSEDARLARKQYPGQTVLQELGEGGLVTGLSKAPIVAGREGLRQAERLLRPGAPVSPQSAELLKQSLKQMGTGAAIGAGIDVPLQVATTGEYDPYQGLGAAAGGLFLGGGTPTTKKVIEKLTGGRIKLPDDIPSSIVPKTTELASSYKSAQEKVMDRVIPKPERPMAGDISLDPNSGNFIGPNAPGKTISIFKREIPIESIKDNPVVKQTLTETPSKTISVFRREIPVESIKDNPIIKQTLTETPSIYPKRPNEEPPQVAIDKLNSAKTAQAAASHVPDELATTPGTTQTGDSNVAKSFSFKLNTANAAESQIELNLKPGRKTLKGQTSEVPKGEPPVEAEGVPVRKALGRGLADMKGEPAGLAKAMTDLSKPVEVPTGKGVSSVPMAEQPTVPVNEKLRTNDAQTLYKKAKAIFQKGKPVTAETLVKEGWPPDIAEDLINDLKFKGKIGDKDSWIESNILALKHYNELTPEQKASGNPWKLVSQKLVLNGFEPNHALNTARQAEKIVGESGGTKLQESPAGVSTDDPITQANREATANKLGFTLHKNEAGIEVPVLGENGVSTRDVHGNAIPTEESATNVKAEGMMHPESRLIIAKPGQNTMHELGHAMIKNLEDSTNPVDNMLAREGKKALAGNEETLVELMGKKSSEVEAAMQNDKKLQKLALWFKDVVNHTKFRFGSRDPNVIADILGTRLIKDPAIVEQADRFPGLNIKGNTINAPENVKGSMAGARLQEAPENPEVAQAQQEFAKARENAWFKEGMIGTKSTLGKAVESSGEAGPAIKVAAENFFDTRNQTLGKELLPVTKALNSVGPESRAKVWQYGSDLYDKGTSGISLNKKEWSVYETLRDQFVGVQQQAKDMNIPLFGTGKNVVDRIVNPNYWPVNVINNKVLGLLRSNPTSPEAIKLQKEFMQFNVKNQAAADAYIDILESTLKPQTARYAELRHNMGVAIPPGWRESSPLTASARFATNVADDFAWFKHIETNSEARGIFNTTDQFGKRDFNGPNKIWYHGDPKEGLVNAVSENKYVKQLKEHMVGVYSDKDLLIDGFGRVSRSMMMQSGTGLMDVISSIHRMAFNTPIGTWGNLAKSLVKTGTDWKSQLEKTVKAGHLNPRGLASLESSFKGDTAGVAQDILGTVADYINKYSGRELLERVSRVMSYGWADFTSRDMFTKAINGDKAAIKFFEKTGSIGWKEKLAAKDISLIEDASNGLVKLTQQTYDVRDLPDWAMRGNSAALFSLAKWSIGATNNFAKQVLHPLANGDYMPLLKSTLLSFIGGEAMMWLREKLTKSKAPVPTWNEIKNSKQWMEGTGYRLATLAAVSGYAGIMGEAVKQLYDKAEGGQVTGLGLQGLDIVADGAKVVIDMAKARLNGEPIIDVVEAGAKWFAKNHIQNYRYAMAQASELLESQAEQHNRASNANRRDLRVYKMLNEGTMANMSAVTDRPVGSPMTKEFKQTPDIREAMDILINRIIPKLQKGDPLEAMEKLKGLKQNSYQTMPDPSGSVEDRVKFVRYWNYLQQTFGAERAYQILQDYQRQKAVNRMKGQLLGAQD